MVCGSSRWRGLSIDLNEGLSPLPQITAALRRSGVCVSERCQAANTTAGGRSVPSFRPGPPAFQAGGWMIVRQRWETWRADGHDAAARDCVLFLGRPEAIYCGSSALFRIALAPATLCFRQDEMDVMGQGHGTKTSRWCGREIAARVFLLFFFFSPSTKQCGVCGGLALLQHLLCSRLLRLAPLKNLYASAQLLEGRLGALEGTGRTTGVHIPGACRRSRRAEP